MYGFRQKANDEPGLYLTVEPKLNNWEDKGYVRNIYIYIFLWESYKEINCAELKIFHNMEQMGGLKKGNKYF